MNNDRRAILALVAMGRITAGEAERLLAAWNESREMAWILIGTVGLALMAQLHLHDILRMLGRLISTQAPAVAHIMGPVIGGMGGLL